MQLYKAEWGPAAPLWTHPFFAVALVLSNRHLPKSRPRMHSILLFIFSQPSVISLVLLSRAALLTLIVFRWVTSAMSARACDYPNGVVIDIYLPCNDSAQVSTCCDAGNACGTSGICYGNSGYIYRGGCTDQSWGAAACKGLPCVNGLLRTAVDCSIRH